MHFALRLGKNGLLQVGAFSLLYFAYQQAQAACLLIPTPDVDSYVCDSGTSVTGLTDLVRDNTLTLPPGGTGIITGNITFGSGADFVDMNSGRIIGTLAQGDGTDRFGTVTGAVSQGNGIDDFVMNGGQIQSLAQGDGRDTFLMTDGSIVGAFEDGDVAQQTGDDRPG